jgi:hypothetical protein
LDESLRMRNEVKISLYVVSAIAACLFGLLARSSYRHLDQTPEVSSANGIDSATAKAQEHASSGYGRVVTYGGLFFVSIVGLGLLLGNDISHYFGNRVLHSLYNEEGEGIANPEYEVAEQEWANGNHLEAIRLMREYLQRNPREQHAALRIAEIYEKDLSNPLAAALEYEEVLKHKLPPERWGWAAIHLCNLYGKLNQPEKSVALLYRINNEYNATAAAEKARKRLEDLGLSPDAPQTVESQTPELPTSGPKLPPGFTLKKS